jgi:metallophosphoesterase (TIGR00282 family)
LSTYKILFLGDVVGRPGRQALEDHLPALISAHQPLFVVVNAENAASGNGITPRIGEDLFAMGVSAITLGDHAFKVKESYGWLSGPKPVVRPGNWGPHVPGKGSTVVEKEGIALTVAALCGRTFMAPFDDPFRAADELAEASGPHLFLDFHAEATSEKVAMGWHLDGRATAVIGTHTHVPTADARVLPGGCAYQTDAGMCGPLDGVIGTSREIILRRFRTGMPERFTVADGPVQICGIVIEAHRETGRAASVMPVRLTP